MRGTNFNYLSGIKGEFINVFALNDENHILICFKSPKNCDNSLNFALTTLIIVKTTPTIHSMHSLIIKKTISLITIGLIITLSAYYWKVSQSSKGSTFIETDRNKSEIPQATIEKSIDTTSLLFRTSEKKLRTGRRSIKKRKNNRSQWSEPSLEEINYKTPKKRKTRTLYYL